MQQKKLLQKYLRRFNRLIRILSLFGFVVFLLFFLARFFTVNVIELVGAEDRKVRGIKELYGKNIFFVNIEEESQRLKLLNSYLLRVYIKKKYPNKLRLELKWREPIGFLVVDKGFYLLDKEGRILERLKAKPKRYPQINFYQKFNFEYFSPGEFIDYIELKYALKFLDILGKIGIGVNSVDILRGDMIRFNLKGNEFNIYNIYITTSRELEKQVWEVQEIVKHFKLTGSKAKEIDLRFKRPILRN